MAEKEGEAAQGAGGGGRRLAFARFRADGKPFSQVFHPVSPQELIRKGIPHHFRAIVWQLLCSATDMPVKNQYSELLKMSSPCEKLIRRDIARTYPEHEFFKGQDSLGQEVLFNVMKVTSPTAPPRFGAGELVLRARSCAGLWFPPPAPGTAAWRGMTEPAAPDLRTPGVLSRSGKG